MFGAEEFRHQLRSIGIEAALYEETKVVFPFAVSLGKYCGSALKLGLVVPPDFPISPPSGPHLSPPLLPLHPQNDAGHPVGGVHASDDFERIAGDKWQYWSRPFLQWGTTDKSVRTYLRFLNQLFDTQ
ncbi:MAG: hypothetical protein ACR2NS_12845 [Gemmatimonadaceae bacterium]